VAIDTGPPTPEERELTAGMPTNIAAGFIAARRGANPREYYEQERINKDLEGQLGDIIKGKHEGNPLADVTGADVAQAFMDQLAEEGHDPA
jgi:hypothetical protein